LFLRDSFSGFEYVFTLPFVRGDPAELTVRPCRNPEKPFFEEKWGEMGKTHPYD